MKKSWLIIFLAILFNFALLSFGYSQSNVNIRAYVPETEANRNIKINETKQVEPTTKENKYLYFFEKDFFQEEESMQSAQTVHDKIASRLLMWAVIIVAVILILVFIKLVDHYIIEYF